MYCFNHISEANKTFSSQYLGELASHLPMALVALERLGASPDQIDAFRAHYVKRLEPRRPDLGLKLTGQNWHEYLGQNKYHSEYVQYFKTCLGQTGLKQTLETHLPKLFCGVGGGAFHGLIRLGYALDSRNNEEVYEALAYWAVSSLDLGASQLSGKPMKNPAAIFAELSEEFPGFRPDAPNIARRMEIICQLPRFREICSQLDTVAASYQELAPLVLNLFAQTQDFTALHAVTSLHACRIVYEHAPKIDSLANRLNLFVALAAAYVSIRAPQIKPIEVSPPVTWDSVIAAATLSLDDHIPKIVFSCREEYSHSGNPIYLEAAKRYLDKFK